MYEIKAYSGGIYKFKDFKEFVEDLGGLILKKDSFHIIRGEYFLSEEIHVLTIIPHKDTEIVKKMAKDIKGRLESPNLNLNEKKQILSFLPIYDCLSQTNQELSKEDLKRSIECPCSTFICESQDHYCFKEDLEDILDIMVKIGMLDKNITEKEILYKLNKDSE